MRHLRKVRARPEWRSASNMPASKDYTAWLDNGWAQNCLFFVLVLTLGFFAQNVSVGLVLTGLYGAASLVLRLPSETSFRIAILGLIALPILTFAGQQELVGTYAQYVFLLLCIGTVGALIEQWRRHDSIPFEVDLPVYAKVGAVGGSTIQTNMYKDGRIHESKLANSRAQNAFA